MYYKRLKVYFRTPKILEFEDGRSFYLAIQYYIKENIEFDVI